MFEFFIGAILAERGAHALASSALPNAPVVVDPEPRLRTARVRRSLAVAMHHGADWVMPAACIGC